ncbi:hypothetical protein HYX00_00875 [Candidatus Woesearchaeota archaeon]|nr:hypothetical protein [Candidatus Woesearchaeota archaeon]
MLNAKIKQIGNSVGIIIPKDIAKGMSLKPETEVVVEIKKKSNVLRELFGALPKLKDIDLKEVRKDLGSK